MVALARPFVFMRRWSLDSLGALIRVAFLRNKRYFYDRYFGSDNPLILFLKNLVRPIRFFKKFIYGQVIPLPPMLSLATPVEKGGGMPLEWQGYAEILKRDGIVFIPGFFKEGAEYLRERYQLNPQKFPASDKYVRFNIDINDPNILDIVADPMLLALLADYYKCQPFLRALPAINCTHPSSEKARQSIGYNNLWHYDTVNMLTAHVLVNDITDADSCMLYAKRNHRKHRIHLASNDYHYSEEYIRDHFEITPCVGKTGTLIVFDPNGLHRVDLKATTFRAHLHLNYVPGNDMLASKPDVLSGFPPPTEQKLAALTPLQRRSIAHVPFI